MATLEEVQRELREKYTQERALSEAIQAAQQEETEDEELAGPRPMRPLEEVLRTDPLTFMQSQRVELTGDIVTLEGQELVLCRETGEPPVRLQLVRRAIQRLNGVEGVSTDDPDRLPSGIYDTSVITLRIYEADLLKRYREEGLFIEPDYSAA